MKAKIVTSVFAILIAVLSYFYLTYQPVSAKYPLGSCFRDQGLKVKYKVLHVTHEAYEVEVVDSGHYTMSPDYQVGSKQMYLKSTVETQAQYHPAFCEEKKTET